MAVIDMLERGQSWLADKITDHASRQIIYRRGEKQIFVLAAIGVTYISQFADDGISVKAEVRDHLVDVATLKIDDQPIEPQRGDRIIEIVSDTAHHFEVLPIGEQREWRYSDPYRNKFRVHTKSTRFAEPVRPEFAIRETDSKHYLASGQVVDFGAVAVSELKTFTVFNAGTSVLSLGDITLPGGITQIGSYAPTVDIGETTSFGLQLNALSLPPGAFNDDATIETDDPDYPTFLIHITGVVA